MKRHSSITKHGGWRRRCSCALDKERTHIHPIFLFIFSEANRKRWCRRDESNTRPSHYKCAALPTELRRHILETNQRPNKAVSLPSETAIIAILIVFSLHLRNCFRQFFDAFSVCSPCNQCLRSLSCHDIADPRGTAAFASCCTLR